MSWAVPSSSPTTFLLGLMFLGSHGQEGLSWSFTAGPHWKRSLMKPVLAEPLCFGGNGACMGSWEQRPGTPRLNFSPSSRASPSHLSIVTGTAHHHPLPTSEKPGSPTLLPGRGLTPRAWPGKANAPGTPRSFPCCHCAPVPPPRSPDLSFGHLAVLWASLPRSPSGRPGPSGCFKGPTALPGTLSLEHLCPVWANLASLPHALPWLSPTCPFIHAIWGHRWPSWTQLLELAPPWGLAPSTPWQEQPTP